ncbi:MAG: hypothetical protein AAGE84_29070 [Cyanobacteria bacterium P01_G01_bin.39]
MARSRKVDKSFIPVRIIPGSIGSTNLDTNTIAKVEFPGFEPEEITYWQNEGFYQAIALPYEHREIKGVSVLVVKPLLRSNSAAQEQGFSPAVMIITPKTSQIWRLVEDSIEMKESMLSRYYFN